MAAVLLTIDGRPYHKWRTANFNITPNALLSILAVFLKSSLLLLLGEGTGQLKWVYFQQRPHRVLDLQIFDETSCGPLGALKLICSVTLQAVIAIVGALITILTIAIDAFIQQILSFPVAMTDVTNRTATIASSRILPGLGSEVPVLLHHEYPLSSAIVTGMVGAVEPTDYHCSSDDCTWAEYKTLGFCSHVSDQITSRETNHGIIAPSQGLRPKKVIYSLPIMIEQEAVNLTLTTIFYKLREWIGPNILLAVDSSDTPSNEENSTLGTTIATISTMRLGLYYPWNRSTYDNISESIWPQALDCSILLCEKTHSETRYSKGELHDPVTSARHLVMPGLNEMSLYFTEVPFFPAWPVGQSRPSPEALNISHMTKYPDVYWASTGTIEQIVILIQRLLGDSNTLFASALSRGSAMQNSLHADILGNYDYITPTMQDVALSLSNEIRRINTTSMIQGTARAPTTLVHVDWYWFIFPAVLAGLSVVFLSMTVMLSMETGGVLWKTSTLPFLFCDFQSDRKSSGGVALRDMRRTAKKTTAKLQQSENGCMTFTSFGATQVDAKIDSNT